MDTAKTAYSQLKMIEKAKDLGAKTAIHFMTVDALYDHPNSLVRSMEYSSGYVKSG
jgi:hypothetical protein